MRSLIIIEVEHGETTDGLEQFAADAVSEAAWTEGVEVRNFTFRIDLPACFSLEDGTIPSDRT